MSKFITRSALVVLASLALTGTTRAAEPPVTVTGASADAHAVSVRSKADRDRIVGMYEMSDGRYLTLRPRGVRIMAELGDLPVTELRPSSRTQLSSADQRMSMRFGRDSDGNPTVTVSIAVEGAAPQVVASVSAKP